MRVRFELIDVNATVQYKLANGYVLNNVMTILIIEKYRPIIDNRLKTIHQKIIV